MEAHEIQRIVNDRFARFYMNIVVQPIVNETFWQWDYFVIRIYQLSDTSDPFYVSPRFVSDLKSYIENDLQSKVDNEGYSNDDGVEYYYIDFRLGSAKS